ncbi:MAG: hypothetical protein SVP26_11165 [Chloroflexota bacterium]|nr:hypothetical protein [Chloroflexota bacterium]
MSDKISVTLSPDKLEVAPGESVTTTATIKNAGDVVEAYAVEIEGLEPEWCALSVTSVSLFPGDQEQVQVTVQPPKATSSKAGSYTAAIRVVSGRDATVETKAQLAVEVGRYMGFDVGLSPGKARGRRGSYRLTIVNTGNVATTYTFVGQDTEEACRFEFGENAATLEPGATAEVPVTVDPKKKPFTGKAKTYNFTITVSSHASEAGESKKVQGQLECTPLMPVWALAVAAVAVVAIVVVVVVLAMGGGGGPKVNISASPAPPSGCQQVTYTATASSPSGIDRIQIWIDSQLKKECYGATSCSYTEGPYYLQRELNYEARVWDMDGKQATSGLKVFQITSPCPP